MARKPSPFVCSSCGAPTHKWAGRCSACGEWNTIVTARPAQGEKRPAAPVVALSEVGEDGFGRIATGIAEFDMVTGGGIVPGSVILVGGDPGIGKSTLALQVANSFRTFYFSGEESPAQIRHRAERLGVDFSRIGVSTVTSVEEIIAAVEAERPDCVVVDSVQTLYFSEIPGYAGSVSQIREATMRLVDMAKRTGIPVLLIGHITKDGAIAGPKLLEHLVDTVLYFEGDFSRDYRVLRAFKNRYGSVNEIGLFRMAEAGLVEVKDKNSLFLNPYLSSSPGNAVSASLEGSRIILFEVQSLVSFSSFSNPRRMADGFDLNRLILLVAVLEKHGLLKLGTFDVFINVAGGFRITETASDLAVAMSIASSLKGREIPPSTGFVGEIALSGEVRHVSQSERRFQEFARSGFARIVAPKGEEEAARRAGFSGEIVEVGTIAQAMDRLF